MASAVDAGCIIFARWGMVCDCACQPCHGSHVVVGEVNEEVFGVFVLNLGC